MSNRIYSPDRWAVFYVDTGEEVIYKVLGGWYGGYLNGDSWRMSSEILSVESTEKGFLVHNHSGSVYECYNGCYGTTGMSGGVFGVKAEEWEKEGLKVNLLSFEEFVDKFVEIRDDIGGL